jgi:hypothetical protein
MQFEGLPPILPDGSLLEEILLLVYVLWQIYRKIRQADRPGS